MRDGLQIESPYIAVADKILMDVDGPDIARPAPLLGQHTVEILAELGYAETCIEDLAR